MMSAKPMIARGLAYCHRADSLSLAAHQTLVASARSVSDTSTGISSIARYRVAASLIRAFSGGGPTRGTSAVMDGRQ